MRVINENNITYQTHSLVMHALIIESVDSLSRDEPDSA